MAYDFETFRTPYAEDIISDSVCEPDLVLDRSQATAFLTEGRAKRFFEIHFKPSLSEGHFARYEKFENKWYVQECIERSGRVIPVCYF